MAEGGLLDFLQTPEGMGLLSMAAGGMAGARRGAPWNTAGAALLGGIQGYQMASDPQRQIDRIIAGRMQQLGSNNSSKPNIGALNQVAGGASPTNENSAILGAIPAVTPRQAGVGLASDPVLMEMLAYRNPAAANALLKQHEARMVGWEQKPGWNIMPDGTRKFIPGKENQMQSVDANGNYSVSNLIGAVEANAAMKGAEAVAAERAKASLDVIEPGKTLVDANNRPVPMTRLGMANYINGAQQNLQTAPTNGSVVPNMGANTVGAYDNDRISKIVAAAQKPHAYDQYFIDAGKKYGVDPMELKIRSIAESGMNPNAVSGAGAVGPMQLMPKTANGLNVNPRDPRQAIDGAARLISQYQKDAGGNTTMVDMLYYGGPDTNQWKANTQQYAANLNAVRNAMGGGVNIGGAQNAPKQGVQQNSQDVTAGAGLRYPTQDELARAKAKAEADVEVDKQNRLKVQEVARGAEQRYGQISAAIPEARKLLEKATGSGFGSMYDKGASLLGASPSGAIEARQLKTLSGWMTSNVPRMEGPQSDRDTMMYREMAATVGDDTVPRQQRLAALNTLESLQEKYRHLNVPNENRNPAITPRQSNQPIQAGMVKSGYRFKGGNPADRNAWEKI